MIDPWRRKRILTELRRGKAIAVRDSLSHMSAPFTQTIRALCEFCQDLLEERSLLQEKGTVVDLLAFTSYLEDSDPKTKMKALHDLQLQLQGVQDFVAKLQVWIDKQLIENKM